MSENSKQSPEFGEVLGNLGPRLLAALAGLESARRRLHPPSFPEIRASLGPLRSELEAAAERLAATAAPAGLEGLASELGVASDHLLAALGGFLGSGDGANAGPGAVDPARILDAMHRHHRAEAVLFALRRVLPPLNAFYLEAPVRGELAELDPDPPPQPASAGLHRAASDASGRGGFLLYVPESYDGGEWPLIVALHGGAGNGDDFLWTWLREARSRRFVLLAPSSRGSTWSLHAPRVDTQALHRMVEVVRERIAIDPSRVLLTGLSDGATFSTIAGLQDDSPFTALAPISGVLHPMALADPAAAARLEGRRIYLVHGALDWMFPVSMAREAAERLREHGADLVYREVADLSHTYPREENDRILAWFDPSLRLAG